MSFPCTTIIGAIVFVALIFVSLPALAIVAIGSVAIWLLGRSREDKDSTKTDGSGADSRQKQWTAVQEDDAISVDSGVWSAQDFASGAVKDPLVRPHRQPPLPPAGEVSAFRTIKATEGVERTDAMYENHLDSGHYLERMNRGHEGNLKHFYVNGLNNAMKVARKELPMKDPNLLPIDPDEPVGCPRPLGKI